MLLLVTIINTSSSSSSVIAFVSASPAPSLVHLGTLDLTSNSIDALTQCKSNAAEDTMWCGHNSVAQTAVKISLSPLAHTAQTPFQTTNMYSCALAEPQDRLLCLLEGVQTIMVFKASDMTVVTNFDLTEVSFFGLPNRIILDVSNAQYAYVTKGITSPRVYRIDINSPSQDGIFTPNYASLHAIDLCMSSQHPTLLNVMHSPTGDAKWDQFDLSGGFPATATGATSLTITGANERAELATCVGNHAYHAMTQKASIARLTLVPFAYVDTLTTSFIPRFAIATASDNFLIVTQNANTGILIVDLSTFTEEATTYTVSGGGALSMPPLVLSNNKTYFGTDTQSLFEYYIPAPTDPQLVLSTTHDFSGSYTRTPVACEFNSAKTNIFCGLDNSAGQLQAIKYTYSPIAVSAISPSQAPTGGATGFRSCALVEGIDRLLCPESQAVKLWIFVASTMALAAPSTLLVGGSLVGATTFGGVPTIIVDPLPMKSSTDFNIYITQGWNVAGDSSMLRIASPDLTTVDAAYQLNSPADLNNPRSMCFQRHSSKSEKGSKYLFVQFSMTTMRIGRMDLETFAMSGDMAAGSGEGSGAIIHGIACTDKYVYSLSANSRVISRFEADPFGYVDVLATYATTGTAPVAIQMVMSENGKTIFGWNQRAETIFIIDVDSQAKLLSEPACSSCGGSPFFDSAANKFFIANTLSGEIHEYDYQNPISSSIADPPQTIFFDPASITQGAVTENDFPVLVSDNDQHLYTIVRNSDPAVVIDFTISPLARSSSLTLSSTEQATSALGLHQSQKKLYLPVLVSNLIIKIDAPTMIREGSQPLAMVQPVSIDFNDVSMFIADAFVAGSTDSTIHRLALDFSSPTSAFTGIPDLKGCQLSLFYPSLLCVASQGGDIILREYTTTGAISQSNSLTITHSQVSHPHLQEHTNHIYILTARYPVAIVIVDRSTFQELRHVLIHPHPTPVGATSVEGRAFVFDAYNDYFYVWVGVSPSTLFRINVNDYSVQANITGGPSNINHALFLKTKNSIFVASGDSPGTITQWTVSPATESITANYVGSASDTAGSTPTGQLATDGASFIWSINTADPATISKFDFGILSLSATLTLTIAGEAGTNIVYHPPTKLLYLASSGSPTEVVKIDALTMTRLSAVTLAGIASVTSTVSNQVNSIIAVTSESPARVIRYDVTTDAATPLTLGGGDNNAVDVIIDSENSFTAFVKLSTAPLRVAAIAINTMSQIGTTFIAGASISGGGRGMSQITDTLFVMSGSPAAAQAITKAGLSDDSFVHLSVSAHSIVTGVVSDPSFVYMFFSSSPIMMTRISLSNGEPVDTVVLDPSISNVNDVLLLGNNVYMSSRNTVSGNPGFLTRVTGILAPPLPVLTGVRRTGRIVVTGLTSGTAVYGRQLASTSEAPTGRVFAPVPHSGGTVSEVVVFNETNQLALITLPTVSLDAQAVCFSKTANPGPSVGYLFVAFHDNTDVFVHSYDVVATDLFNYAPVATYQLPTAPPTLTTQWMVASKTTQNIFLLHSAPANSEIRRLGTDLTGVNTLVLPADASNVRIMLLSNDETNIYAANTGANLATVYEVNDPFVGFTNGRTLLLNSIPLTLTVDYRMADNDDFLFLFVQGTSPPVLFKIEKLSFTVAKTVTIGIVENAISFHGAFIDASLGVGYAAARRTANSPFQLFRFNLVSLQYTVEDIANAPEFTPMDSASFTKDKFVFSDSSSSPPRMVLFERGGAPVAPAPPVILSIIRTGAAEHSSITDGPLAPQIASNDISLVWGVTQSAPSARLLAFDLVNYQAAGSLLLPGGVSPKVCLYSKINDRIYTIAQDATSTTAALVYIIDPTTLSPVSAAIPVSGSSVLANAEAATIDIQDGFIFAVFGQTNPATVVKIQIGNSSTTPDILAADDEMTLGAGETAPTGIHLDHNRTGLYVACASSSTIVKIDLDHSSGSYFQRVAAVTLSQGGVAFRMADDGFFLYVTALAPSPPALVKIEMVLMLEVAAFTLNDDAASATSMRGLLHSGPPNANPFDGREFFFSTGAEAPMRLMKVIIPSGVAASSDTSLWTVEHVSTGFAGDDNIVDGASFAFNSYIAAAGTVPPRVIRFISGQVAATETTTTTTTTTVLPPTTTTTTTAIVPVIPPVITSKTTLSTVPVPVNIEDILGNLFYSMGYATATCDIAVIRSAMKPCVDQFHVCHQNTRFNFGGGACPASMATCVVQYTQCLLDNGKAVLTGTGCEWSDAFYQYGSEVSATTGTVDITDCSVFVHVFGISYYNCAPSYSSVCNQVVQVIRAYSTAAAPAEITKTDLTGRTLPRGMMPIVIAKRETDTTCSRPYFDGRCRCPTSEGQRFDRLRLFEPSFLHAALNETDKRSASNFDICYSLGVSTFENVSFTVANFQQQQSSSSSSSSSVVVDRSADSLADSSTTPLSSVVCSEGRTLRELKVLAEGSNPNDAVARVLAVCANRDTNVFILRSLDGACYSPRANVSCSCGDATSSGVPITYLNATTNVANSGVLIVCNFKLPPKVTTQQIVTTTITGIAGLSAGPGAAGLQGAAVATLLSCDGEGSSDTEEQGGRFALIPITIGNSEAKGMLFLLAATFGSFFVYLSICAILAFCRYQSCCCDYCSGHDKGEPSVTENPKRVKYLALKKLYDTKYEREMQKKGALRSDSTNIDDVSDLSPSKSVLIDDDNDDHENDAEKLHPSRSHDHLNDTGGSINNLNNQSCNSINSNNNNNDIVYRRSNSKISIIIDDDDNNNSSRRYTSGERRRNSNNNISDDSAQHHHQQGCGHPDFKHDEEDRHHHQHHLSVGHSRELNESVNSASPISSHRRSQSQIVFFEHTDTEPFAGSDIVCRDFNNNNSEDNNNNNNEHGHDNNEDNETNTNTNYDDDDGHNSRSSSAFKFMSERRRRSNAESILMEQYDGNDDSAMHEYFRSNSRRRSSLHSLAPGKVKKVKKTIDEKMIITYIDDITGKEKKKRLRKKFKYGHLDNKKMGFMYHFWNSCASLRFPGFYCFVVLRIFFQGLAYESFYLIYRETGTNQNIGIVGLILTTAILIFFMGIGYVLQYKNYCPYGEYRYLYKNWPQWAQTWVGPNGMWPDNPQSYRHGLAWDDFSGYSRYIGFAVPMNYIKAVILASVTAYDWGDNGCDFIFYILIGVFFAWVLLQYLLRPVYRFFFSSFSDALMSFLTGLMLLLTTLKAPGQSQVYLTIVYAGLSTSIVNQVLAIHEFVVGFCVEVDDDEEENNLDWETDEDNDDDVYHREKPKMKKMLNELQGDAEAMEALENLEQQEVNQDYFQEDSELDEDLFTGEEEEMPGSGDEYHYHITNHGEEEDDDPILFDEYGGGYMNNNDMLYYDEGIAEDTNISVNQAILDRLSAAPNENEKHWQTEEYDAESVHFESTPKAEEEEVVVSEEEEEEEEEQQQQQKEPTPKQQETPAATTEQQSSSMTYEQAIEKRKILRNKTSVNERRQHQRSANFLMSVETFAKKKQVEQLKEKEKAAAKQRENDLLYSLSSPQLSMSATFGNNNNKHNTSKSSANFNHASSLALNPLSVSSSMMNPSSTSANVSPKIFSTQASFLASSASFEKANMNNNNNNDDDDDQQQRSNSLQTTSRNSPHSSPQSPHYVKKVQNQARGSIGESVIAMTVAAKLRAKAEKAKQEDQKRKLEELRMKTRPSTTSGTFTSNTNNPAVSSASTPATVALGETKKKSTATAKSSTTTTSLKPSASATAAPAASSSASSSTFKTTKVTNIIRK